MSLSKLPRWARLAVGLAGSPRVTLRARVEECPCRCGGLGLSRLRAPPSLAVAVPGLLVPFCRKYALLLTPAGEVVAYLFQPRPIGVLVPRLPARVSAWALRGIRP